MARADVDPAGGPYSYDWLDRLFGFLERPSATRILPQFQRLAVSDKISWDATNSPSQFWSRLARSLRAWTLTVCGWCGSLAFIHSMIIGHDWFPAARSVSRPHCSAGWVWRPSLPAHLDDLAVSHRTANRRPAGGLAVGVVRDRRMESSTARCGGYRVAHASD
jgi:hypothetical protein